MENETTERSMRHISAPAGVGVTSSGSTINCNTFTNSCDKFYLTKDEHLKEWRALLNEARNITAASSLPMVLWKVCKFFFDETSPVVLAWILINILIKGEGSWIHYCIPVLINVILSAVIAYYCCNEKREVVRARQGQHYSSLFCDTIKKMIALMFDWITECSRGVKRSNKIRIIEDNMYRHDYVGRSVKREDFVALAKFYSSHLRYLREDILVTTLRSFTLAMFAMYTMADSENLTFRLCFKLGYVIWIILKTSYIMKSFQGAKQGYVATVQLWGAIWTEYDSTLKIELCEYHKIQEFEKTYPFTWAMMILDMLLNVVLMANRIISAILCLILLGPLGPFVWYFLIVGANIFVLDFLSYNGLNIRNKYDNPPTGYTRKRHVWIDRFMSGLFYNYGYSSREFKGVFGWKTLFAIPPTIIFLFACLYGGGTLNSTTSLNASNADLSHTSLFNTAYYNNVSLSKSAPYHHPQCNLAPYSGSQSETDTYSVLNCIQKELSSNPINVIGYLGGITTISYIVLFHVVYSFFIELILKLLQKRQNIRLDKFEVFPYFDAINCYRSLINGVLQKSNSHIIENPVMVNSDSDGNNDHLIVRKENQRPSLSESYTQNMMTITVFDSADFNNTWSDFKMLKIASLGRLSMKFSTHVNFNNLRKRVIAHCLPLQKVGELLTARELEHFSKLAESSRITSSSSLQDLISGKLSDISLTLAELNVINAGSTEECHSLEIDIDSPITLEELVAIRVIKKLSHHPLESEHNDNYNNANLMSQIFKRIQLETQFCSLEEEDRVSWKDFKRQYVLLFVIFCTRLDTRLTEMSSSRLEKTFEMLDVEISKTYLYMNMNINNNLRILN